MSAIWGAVNLTGGEIAKEEIRLLKAAFAKCRIDRYEEICAQHIYMGCGIQYFVPQAKEEQLPCTESGIYFTVDAVLDNRRELCERLGIQEEVDTIPDGELLSDASAIWHGVPQ